MVVTMAVTLSLTTITVVVEVTVVAALDAAHEEELARPPGINV